MPSDVAVQHQRDREALALATARAVRALWSQVAAPTCLKDWAALLGAVVRLVAGSQRQAVGMTVPYLQSIVPAAFAADPAALPPVLVTDAFVGVAPSGAPLPDELFTAAANAAIDLRNGASESDALARGALTLDRVVRTIVADTGRSSDRAAMVGTKRITGYIRVVEQPACSRCIILSGKVFGWSTKGFLRHPNCDCAMEPIYRHQTPKVPSPLEIFNAMPPEERNRVFGEDAAKAIANGGDIYRWVNDKRGMSDAATRRPYTGPRKPRRERPPMTPARIAKIATDRRHEESLLRVYGFIK